MSLSHLAHQFGEFHGSVEPQPSRPAFYGVSRCSRSVAPNGCSAYRSQLHGISDEDYAESTEQAPLALIVSVRGSSCDGLPASDAHESKQILPDHGHFVNEDVLDAFELLLQVCQGRRFKCASIGACPTPLLDGDLESGVNCLQEPKRTKTTRANKI